LQYVPGSVSAEPTVWGQLSFDTVWDRFASGFYFMALGWDLALGAGLVLLLSGAWTAGARHARPIVALLGVAMAAVALIFLWGPLKAEHALTRAIVAQARGRSEEASGYYRQALQADPWYARNAKIYARIGSVDGALGRKSTPEYQIFYAESLAARAQLPNAVGGLPAAISIYDKLAQETAGPILALATQRAIELRTLYGARLFNGGSFGSAVQTWKSALVRDPDFWIAAYYLSRGYYTLGQYKEAAALSEETIRRAQADPTMLGSLYGNLGDVHTRMGDLSSAHLDYFQSYDHDYRLNSRGLTSVIGP